ncbi:hypothetical protein C8J56DRAFT_1045923 [Mycena floridula]|nr:hypothetical protein C8J56DRAFT_1045923 [Mycena floridula]
MANRVKAMMAVHAASANASKPAKKANSDKICHNPSHDKPKVGHTIDQCYATGGGKAGQYPAHWRLPEGETRIPALPKANTAKVSTPTAASASISTPGKVYILSAQGPTSLENRISSGPLLHRVSPFGLPIASSLLECLSDVNPIAGFDQMADAQVEGDDDIRFITTEAMDEDGYVHTRGRYVATGYSRGWTNLGESSDDDEVNGMVNGWVECL